MARSSLGPIRAGVIADLAGPPDPGTVPACPNGTGRAIMGRGIERSPSGIIMFREVGCEVARRPEDHQRENPRSS
jgi:hypothetical protein